MDKIRTKAWERLTAVRREVVEGGCMREGEGITHRTYIHDSEQRGAGSGGRQAKCLWGGYGYICENFNYKNIVKHHNELILNAY